MGLKTFCGCIIMILFLTQSVFTQDVEQMISSVKERLDSDPFSWSGNLQADFRFNSISAAARRRDPFNLNLFGTINLNVLGMNAPLSLAISDGSATYNLPSYSFVGLSPSYKWAKVHLFRRNMTFSDYTLNGHGFNGVGVELAPGKFRLMAMHGILRKARLEDYGFRHQLDPFYHRKGYALKAGYQDKQNQIFLTLFKASDDENSVVIHDSLGIYPQDNVVASLGVKKHLSDVLTLEGEYAYSILTTGNDFLPRKTIGFEKALAYFLDFNASSKSSSAYNFGIAFSPKLAWTLTLNYERVNPNFTSLGNLQFRNDFENIAVGYRGRLAKIVSLNGRFGIERNNLDNQEIESRNRIVGSIQFNMPINKQWQNTLSFSNFRQTTRIIDNTNPFDPLDSIYLGSINQQFGATSSFQFYQTQRLVINASLQRANSIIQDQISNSTSTVHNIGVSYYTTPKESKLSAGATILWNGMKQADIKTSVWSPAAQLNYRATELLNLSLAVTNNFTQINQVSNGSIIRLAVRGQYSLEKKHRISLRLQYLERSGAVANNFTEFNGQIGYSLHFQ